MIILLNCLEIRDRKKCSDRKKAIIKRTQIHFCVLSDCRKTMFFDKKREFEGNSLKTKIRQKSGHVPDFWLIARAGAVSAVRTKALESKRMRVKRVFSLKVSTLSTRSKDANTFLRPFKMRC